MQIIRWGADSGKLELGRFMARLKDEGYNPRVVEDQPGVSYATHSHDEAQVRWVVSGCLEVGLKLTGEAAADLSEGMDWVATTLEAGDRLELEAGVEHWVTVGPQGASYLVAERG